MNVYEFTNKRKLTKAEFLRWFQKKFLYTIRKFGMIKSGDVLSYKKSGDFRDAVLADLLKMYSEKSHVELKKINARDAQIIYVPHQTSSRCSTKENVNVITTSKRKNLAKPILEQINKVAISETTSSESEKIIADLFNGKLENKKHLPVQGKIIKPLYLFLDKEVLLYAKLRGLTFSKPKEDKNKIFKLIKNLETKHPEIEHGIVNSYLELF